MKEAESFITTMEPKHKGTVQVQINNTQFSPLSQNVSNLFVILNNWTEPSEDKLHWG